MIETPRLRLRRWRDDDVEHLARLNGDERFRRFLGPGRDAHEQLSELRAHWDEHGFGQLAIEELETGRFAGRTGLSFHPLWPDDPEVGWALDPELWGLGYATEAGSAVLGWALGDLGFPRVVALIHPENRASVRVAEKVGQHHYASVHSEKLGVDLLVYAREAPRR